MVILFEEQADSLISIARPADIAEITQDRVNSVIRRYADPDFHCQLHTLIHPTTHVSHPIVAVPGGLSEPIISRRACSGTIQQHRCYIRKPGPRSEAPQTAEEWRTLLRRCVQANREDMLSAIRAIVLGRAETETTTTDANREFEDFRTSSFERWRTLTDHLSPESPERFPDGYYEVSIHPTDVMPAPSVRVLKDHLAEARRIKLTGWIPFLEMNREEWRPYPIGDYIEAWIGRRIDEKTPREPDNSDYWRASRKGQLYTIRGYDEDSLEVWKRVQAGAAVDVTLPIWRVGEILYFATRFLDELEDLESILIHCRFTGLVNRTLISLTSMRSVNPRPCLSDHVETSTNVTLQQLRENLVEIVHQLLTPLYEAFDFFTLSRTLVEEELSKLRENRF